MSTQVAKLNREKLVSRSIDRLSIGLPCDASGERPRRRYGPPLDWSLSGCGVVCPRYIVPRSCCCIEFNPTDRASSLTSTRSLQRAVWRSPNQCWPASILSLRVKGCYTKCHQLQFFQPLIVLIFTTVSCLHVIHTLKKPPISYYERLVPSTITPLPSVRGDFRVEVILFSRIEIDEQSFELPRVYHQ